MSIIQTEFYENTIWILLNPVIKNKKSGWILFSSPSVL